MALSIKVAAVALLAAGLYVSTSSIYAQSTVPDKRAIDGDGPADPGPLATDLSPDLKPTAIKAAMRKVADWQSARVEDTPSQDWTYATLYAGLLSASTTLQEQRYRDLVLHVAEHYHWTLGPRQTHADDQAIGQSYLWLYRQSPKPERIQPLKTQFDTIMQLPDDPAKPVWWWCDALFMAPPVWSGLAAATRDPKYITYMNHEWRVTSDLLWDPQEQLFFRDKNYLDKHEKNGRKVFWSRGNGWVMGGIVRVLETLPADSPDRAFYIDKFQRMAEAVAKIQGQDGLWRAGLLDADDYRYPEVSGSAFFIYAIAWGINHHLLDARKYMPVVTKGWAGMVHHIYADGRLGCIQPVGEAPGAYTESSSYVFGVGAFLLAGTELNQLSQHAGQ